MSVARQLQELAAGRRPLVGFPADAIEPGVLGRIVPARRCDVCSGCGDGFEPGELSVVVRPVTGDVRVHLDCSF